MLALPTDRPRPALQTYCGASLPFALPDELARGLRELGTREGATLFMTLLATFQALLGRYAGQDDFAVGSPVAGRGRAELEGLIGFFVNALVMRADLSGDPTFRELLGRVRETALGAFAHQDVPFAKLVEALRPPRDASRHPLFQVLFVLQNAPTAPPPGLGGRAELLWLDLGVARHDLTLDLVDEGEGLHGRWEFNTDLFDETAVRRMHDHWLTLLKGVVANAGRTLSELPLPPRGEVDRRTLHAPVAERAAARFVEPRTPNERALAAIWAELLGVERVGAADNFFELGGESLLAVRMIHRAREAGLPLALRDLFLHQTVSELATRADNRSLSLPDAPQVTAGANEDVAAGNGR
jgi:non-ribosomal peptide synthetase component F